MKFTFEGRTAESSFVDAIWRTQSEGSGSFISVAESHWGMVITKQLDKMFLTVRGPETIAIPAPVPEDAEFFGINFKLGVYMPHLPTPKLVDDEMHLPEAGSKTFWFHGSSWEFPTYENADTFIDRLVREGLLAYEPVVEAALQEQPQSISSRSVERRFLQATGLTQGAIRQIERARTAVSLLNQGVSILDTIDQAGYYDQPHLTRALKRLIGQTPAQILREKIAE